MRRILALFFFLLLPIIPSRADITTGLVGWWKMEDNAANTTVTDSSGSSNTGTAVNNTSTMSTTGKINKALLFNGSSDGITLTSNPPDPPATFSAWIYPTSLPATQQRIVGKLDGCCFNDYGYGMFLDGASLVGISALVNMNWHDNLNTPISANVWSHVVFTMSGLGANQTGALYVNGVLKVTYTNTSDDSWGYSPIIGYGNSNGPGFYFHGNIDDVRFYNRVLSAADVAELYHTTYPRTKSLKGARLRNFRIAE